MHTNVNQGTNSLSFQLLLRTTHTTYKINVMPLLNRFAFQIREEIPAEVPTAVIKPQLAVDLVNLVHVVCVQLEVSFVVGLDSGRRFRLGENREAIGDSPGFKKSNSI